jgi:hypothetical protein
MLGYSVPMLHQPAHGTQDAILRDSLTGAAQGS